MSNLETFHQIQECISAGRYSKASRKIKALLRIDPENIQLIELLCDCLTEKKRYSSVIAVCERMLMIHTSCKLTHSLMNAYISTNQLEKISSDYIQNSSYIGEESQKHLENISKYYYYSRNFPEAENTIQMLLTINSKNHKAYFLRGAIEFNNKNYDVARENFQKAYKIKKKILSFVMMVESNIYFRKKVYIFSNLLILLSTFFVDFPQNYLLIFIFISIRLWELFSGIITKNKARIKYSFYTILIYPFVLIFIHNLISE